MIIGQVEVTQKPDKCGASLVSVRFADLPGVSGAEWRENYLEDNNHLQCGSPRRGGLISLPLTGHHSGNRE
jgi:hypothetical protein